MEQNKNSENNYKYYCEKCKFSCKKESNFKIHLLTLKHNNNEINQTKIIQNHYQEYKCNICNNIFNSRTSLWRHKKNCKNIHESFIEENIHIEKDEIIPSTEIVLRDNQINKLSEIVKDLLQQNSELVQTIKEMTPKLGNNNTINNNNCNNTNNTFNLNVFLNEKCKDAINLSDFIKTIKFTESDLENSRIHGGVSTLSNVMIKGLQQLDVTKRPLHCTDAKRETLYIKEKEKWEKDENHEKIMDAFTDIAEKQREYIWEWSDANPDTQDVMHPLNDIFHLTNVKVLDPINKKEEQGKKFIRNITKEILINKNMD